MYFEIGKDKRQSLFTVDLVAAPLVNMGPLSSPMPTQAFSCTCTTALFSEFLIVLFSDFHHKTISQKTVPLWNVNDKQTTV